MIFSYHYNVIELEKLKKQRAANKERIPFIAGNTHQLVRDWAISPVRVINHLGVIHDMQVTGAAQNPSNPSHQKAYTQFINQHFLDRDMNQFIKKYSHQGGFLNSGRFHLNNAYRPDPLNPESLEIGVRLDTENPMYTFEICSDGSVIFTEQFDIMSYQDLDEKKYTPQQGSIATITLKSRITCDGDSHKIEALDFGIKAHHKLALDLFTDRRGFFDRFIVSISNFFSRISGKPPKDLVKSKL